MINQEIMYKLFFIQFEYSIDFKMAANDAETSAWKQNTFSTKLFYLYELSDNLGKSCYYLLFSNYLSK